jgi:hypothetical protein
MIKTASNIAVNQISRVPIVIIVYQRASAYGIIS